MNPEFPTPRKPVQASAIERRLKDAVTELATANSAIKICDPGDMEELRMIQDARAFYQGKCHALKELFKLTES